MDSIYDVIIVGTGAAGLFCALNLPSDKKTLVLTKKTAEESNSFLAQGGICVLKDESDYHDYFEDTMRAGHYENNPVSVETIIRQSPEIIRELVSYGVEFNKDKNGKFDYTQEAAHRVPRILFHKDMTGKEITGKLLAQAKKRTNIEIAENTTVLDLVCRDNICSGVVLKDSSGEVKALSAGCVVLASGGLSGLYKNSTGFRHITGDGLAIALRHGITLENINYIQIHPTSLYSKKPGRRFLISESVRGEGAVLLNKNMERFTDELLPRDVLTNEIKKQMEKDNSEFVWLSMTHMDPEVIKKHFATIYERCLEEGYDVTKECIPVTPAQHYHMGGIKVDANGKTSMARLYAVGEACCNGVHGANRLASNSLLESLVFAKAAAKNITVHGTPPDTLPSDLKIIDYMDADRLEADYRRSVYKEIERINRDVRFYNNEVEYR